MTVLEQRFFETVPVALCDIRESLENLVKENRKNNDLLKKILIEMS